MALAGIDALRVLRQFRYSDEQIRRRYLSQNHVLNDIRSDVYFRVLMSATIFLEPDSKRAEGYRTSLEDAGRHMESALEFYGREATPTEVQHYSALRSELMDYWGILAPSFNGIRRKGGIRDTPFCGMRSFAPPKYACNRRPDHRN